MFQLDLFAQRPEDPPTLHQLKRAGLAFIVRTWRGHSVWLPFWLGALTGMYFTADSSDEALQARDSFNQGRFDEPTNERTP